MKRLLFFVLAVGIAAVGFSQYASFYSTVGKGKQVVAKMVKTSIADEIIPGQQQPNGYVSSLKSTLADPTIMNSYYDLQTNNTSGQQRICQFSDGSVAGVATMSLTATGTTWPDRGTGYNYSADNGITWGPAPTVRVEVGTRTGWPSIQPLGANGECTIAHQSTGNLLFSQRTTKGTGTWTTTAIPAPPSGVPAMLWPRMVTNGTNHMNVHLIALTEPTGNNGVIYNNMDGCLMYCKSTDGGTTFSPWEQLPGTTSNEYLNFSADQYSWAPPHGDTLAFIVGDTWIDVFMMKSTDNGNTWTKTVIFSNPYNLVGYTGNNAWFYSCDGTDAIALDYYGNAHICFGLMEDSNGYYRPYTSGLVYWNETMPQLPAVLDPNVLYNMGNLIAWQLDTTIYPPSAPYLLAAYYSSLTSNPGILIDKNNDMFIIWSSVTSYVDQSGNYYLRHVFEKTGKVASDGSFFFHSAFTDLTSEFVYNFMECVYADIAQTSYDDMLHIIFQGDNLAGSYVKGLNISGYAGQTTATNNSFIVLNPPKPLWEGVENNNINKSLMVSANYPNPFHGTTYVTLANPKAGNLRIEVINTIGQKVSMVDYGYINAGSGRYAIDGSQLSPGIYFFTVKVGNDSYTGRMIVD